MSIKLGVPSKGRLMEKTFQWFGARDVTLGRAGSDREYAGFVEGIDNVELVLLSAGEIPRELAAGRIHLGVTGTDLVREKLGPWNADVRELAALGFGQADLILAVPSAWVDVNTLDDLGRGSGRVSAGARIPVADRDQVSPAGAGFPARPRRGGLSACRQPGGDRRDREERDRRSRWPISPRPATRCGPTI